MKWVVSPFTEMRGGMEWLCNGVSLHVSQDDALKAVNIAKANKVSSFMEIKIPAGVYFP
jgi:hypothetical protein